MFYIEFLHLSAILSPNDTMNLLLLISSLVLIIGSHASPIITRHRRSGPDGDLSDPIGSAGLRPVFLGKPSGLANMRPFARRNAGQDLSLDAELTGPEGPPDISPKKKMENFEDLSEHLAERADLSQLSSQSFAEDSVDSDSEPKMKNDPMNEDEHFGLPNRAIQAKIERQRRVRDKIKNQHLHHPDSDVLRAKSNRFVVATDDPLPEMIAGGDLEANPYPQQVPLSQVFGKLLMQSIGLK